MNQNKVTLESASDSFKSDPTEHSSVVWLKLFVDTEYTHNRALFVIITASLDCDSLIKRLKRG